MKTAIETAWKTAAVTMAAMAAMAIVQPLLSGFDSGWQEPPPASEILPPALFAMLMTVAVLIYPVTHSTLHGGRLVLAVFAAVFGINVFLTQVEAALFLRMTPSQLTASALQLTLQAVVVSVLVVMAFGRGARPSHQPSAQPALSPRGWLGRVAVCSIAYAVLYVAAGMLIIPYVASYYETQNMPSPVWILPNALVRGALYLAFALPLVRSLVGSRRRVALATAVLFPILAGAAGLLIPNPFMPDWVRPFHAVEIGVSNFLFGLLVGYMFWRPQAGDLAAPRPAPGSTLEAATANRSG